MLSSKLRNYVFRTRRAQSPSHSPDHHRPGNSAVLLRGFRNPPDCNSSDANTDGYSRSFCDQHPYNAHHRHALSIVHPLSDAASTHQHPCAIGDADPHDHLNGDLDPHRDLHPHTDLDVDSLADMDKHIHPFAHALSFCYPNAYQHAHGYPHAFVNPLADFKPKPYPYTYPDGYAPRIT